jgi:hypothetical protein
MLDEWDHQALIQKELIEQQALNVDTTELQIFDTDDCSMTDQSKYFTWAP